MSFMNFVADCTELYHPIAVNCATPIAVNCTSEIAASCTTRLQ
jgi:hypothetical protein